MLLDGILKLQLKVTLLHMILVPLMLKIYS